MKKTFLTISLCLVLTFITKLSQAQNSNFCYESEIYPIRVCSDSENDEQKAQYVIEYTELIWQVQIGQMGFPTPWRLDDNGEPENGIDIVIGDSEYSMTVNAVADIPQTPHSDCATQVLLSREAANYAIDLLWPGIISWALQYADDCLEMQYISIKYYITIPFLKQINNSPEDYITAFLSDFIKVYQSNPYLALDYYNLDDENLDEYIFGLDFLHMFIDDRWGDGDGKIIAEISFASRQNGTVEIEDNVATGENNPIWFDAVDAVLKTKGSDYWQMVKEFSVWRVFTGEFADDNHISYADLFQSVAIDTSYDLSELPITKAEPKNKPQETGTSYISVNIESDMIISDEDLITFELNSSENDNWYVAAIIMNSDGTSKVEELDINNGTGKLETDQLTNVDQIIYAVTNLGDLEYEFKDWDDSNFNYNISLVNKINIESIDPQEVKQGDENVNITIKGIGFGPGIEADFGDNIEVSNKIVDTSGETISLRINVSRDAQIGWHSLRLFYENGIETVKEQGIEVISNAGPSITKVEPDSSEPGKTLNISIYGERFSEGLTLNFSDLGIAVDNLDYINETSIAATITISSDAEQGARDITVTNPDSQSYTLSNAFTIELTDSENNKGCSCNLAANQGESNNIISLFSGIIFLLFLFIRKQ